MGEELVDVLVLLVAGVGGGAVEVDPLHLGVGEGFVDGADVAFGGELYSLGVSCLRTHTTTRLATLCLLELYFPLLLHHLIYSDQLKHVNIITS